MVPTVFIHLQCHVSCTSETRIALRRGDQEHHVVVACGCGRAHGRMGGPRALQLWDGLVVRCITAGHGTLHNLSSLFPTVFEPAITSAVRLTSPSCGKSMWECEFTGKCIHIDKHHMDVSCSTRWGHGHSLLRVYDSTGSQHAAGISAVTSGEVLC